jgi:TolB protein
MTMKPVSNESARRRSLTMRTARRSSRLFLALVLLGLFVLPAGVAHATFPGTNGRIAFADWATGQIYAVNSDGTGLVQLTHTREFAGDPSWSPDGTRIVFEKPYRDRLVLWLMNADGTHKRMVADDDPNTFSFSPVFTPDGGRILFTRCSEFRAPTGDRLTTCRIYSIAPNGTDRQGLTSTQPPLEVFDFEPMVSPDGRTVAFTRHNQNYDGIRSRIYLMGIDGSNPRAITDSELEAWYPDWSPDGQQIAFTSNCCRPGDVLGYGLGSAGYVMNADGTNVRQLTTPTFPHNDVHFIYSPDGRQLVFATDRDNNLQELCCDTEAFTMSADGTEPAILDTGLPAPHDFSWGTAPPIANAAGPAVSRMTAGTVASRLAARCHLVPRRLRDEWGCG